MRALARHKLPWSTEEDDYLRTHLDTPLLKLALKLGRSKVSVEHRRYNLDITAPWARKPPTETVRALAEKWAPLAGCTADDVMSDDRTSHIAWARHQVIGELYATGRYSMPGIGGALGLDHSSVHYALSRVDRPCPIRSPKTIRLARRKRIARQRKSVTLIFNVIEPPKPLATSIAPIPLQRLMAGRA